MLRGLVGRPIRSGDRRRIEAGVLRALALEMEQAALGGDLQRVSALLPSATEEYERFRAVLQMAGWRGRDLNP